jgi:hypothetical protein
MCRLQHIAAASSPLNPGRRRQQVLRCKFGVAVNHHPRLPGAQVLELIAAVQLAIDSVRLLIDSAVRTEWRVPPCTAVRRRRSSKSIRIDADIGKKSDRAAGDQDFAFALTGIGGGHRLLNPFDRVGRVDAGM